MALRDRWQGTQCQQFLSVVIAVARMSNIMRGMPVRSPCCGGYGVVRYTYGVVVLRAVKPSRRRIGADRSVASTWRWR
ncbi:hypothetical protein QFZ58_001449 [Streptomyces sp. B1I3]|nr:hypothetical protein [Streptomyces sp. B1I3]